MINQQQINFRHSYRNRIAGWYSGLLHVTIIYSIGFCALWVFSQKLIDVSLLEYTTVPITLFLSNIFEWYLHKNIMHRPQKNPALRAIYERHTLNHHKFFTDKEMRFKDTNDWRVTIFPPYALVIFILISSIGVLALKFIATDNIAWLFIFSTTSFYLIYEFMHFCCHIQENLFVKYCPFVNTIRRHHTAHHNNRIMADINLNLTFPIADYLFKTSDLNRGFFGHIFNGYEDKYQKNNLREIPNLPGSEKTKTIS